MRGNGGCNCCVARSLAQVHPSDVITRARAAGSAEVLTEIERVKDAPLRPATVDGKCVRLVAP